MQVLNFEASSYLDSGIPSASTARLAARDIRRCFDNFDEPSRYPKFSMALELLCSISDHSLLEVTIFKLLILARMFSNWCAVFFFSLTIIVGDFFVERTFSQSVFVFVFGFSSFLSKFRLTVLDSFQVYTHGKYFQVAFCLSCIVNRPFRS